jgi:hypothetical protein
MFAAGRAPKVPLDPIYVEDVFSTYLANADGSNTIVNGIDLSTYGGMNWKKTRSAGYGHDLRDSARGFRYGLEINTGAQFDSGAGFFTANTNGFSDSHDSGGNTDVWWTFRKQAKFFDVVTYTGNGLQENKVVPHNLGSVPGMVIIKAYSGPSTDAVQNWAVFHRNLTAINFMRLNTAAQQQESGQMFRQAPDATNIYVGDDQMVNKSGVSYVAYVFAHDAGGFGLTGADNIISCGSYTGGGTPEINLGYEPMWVMVKQMTYSASPSNAGAWYIVDNMRTFPDSGSSNALQANLTNGENGWFNSNFIVPTSTGFKITYAASGGGSEINDTGQTYIYMAIRRPMKVPTDATKVFAPVAYTGSSSARTITMGFPTDLFMTSQRDRATNNYFARVVDRLRGRTRQLATNATFTEGDFGSTVVTSFDNMTGVSIPSTSDDKFNNSGTPFIAYGFRRAPGFFDQVCYTGDGINGRSITHKLGVEPEMIIVKPRSISSSDWIVYVKNNGTSQNSQAILNGDNAFGWYSGMFPSPYASSTTFQIASNSAVNGSGSTYVAYLFATCPGVSKVGTYAGNGSSQTINCGFASSARFVMTKAANTSGNWFMWDTARGINAGDDPRLAFNSTAAEVTNTDSIDADSSGFIVNNDGNFTNASGTNYIFLAIA